VFWRFGRLACWLAGWLAGLLAGWLAGWLVAVAFNTVGIIGVVVVL
jgi:hypothetical protein